MKIKVQDKGRAYRIFIPGRLIWGRLTLRLVRYGLSKASCCGPDILSQLPPEAVEKLLLELRRLKKMHGSLELVEINTAQGQYIKVTL